MKIWSRRKKLVTCFMSTEKCLCNGAIVGIRNEQPARPRIQIRSCFWFIWSTLSKHSRAWLDYFPRNVRKRVKTFYCFHFFGHICVNVFCVDRLPVPGSDVQSGGIETKELLPVCRVCSYVSLKTCIFSLRMRSRYVRGTRRAGSEFFPLVLDEILTPSSPPFEFGVTAQSALRAWWRHQRGRRLTREFVASS